MLNSRILTSARLLVATTLTLGVLALPGAAAHAGEPTLTKSLSQSQPVRNDDGTFPSGSIVTYEISVGCSAPGDCDNFELHEVAPTFTDVDGNTASYNFVSASPSGPGPAFVVDSIDPADVTFTFPEGFSAGSSLNIELSFEIPPGITPDGTVATNTAIWGEYDVDGNPLPSVVTDTAIVTSTAKASFEVTKTGPATVTTNEPVEFVVALCGDDPNDPYYGPLRGLIEDATLTDTIPPALLSSTPVTESSTTES